MLKFKIVFIAVLTALLVIGLFGVGYGKDSDGSNKAGRLQKTGTNDDYLPMIINNVLNYYSNGGDGSFNPYAADNEGFEFPRGSGGDVLYEDGLVWGGYQNGVKKINGSTYYHGLQAGKIITPGVNGVGMVAANASDAANRIFRVRPDITPSTTLDQAASILSKELTDRNRFGEGLTIAGILNRYVQDWENWPASSGAPFTYGSGRTSGPYDWTQGDIPGVAGADMSMWMVMNDCDATRAYFMGGQTPIGFEVQRTIWAYNQSGALGNTIFLKYKVINKSGSRIDTMYFTQWSDPDLGGSLGGNDDYVACDTTLNLGYVYNGAATDAFYGKAVPAGGFCFFQGPVVPGKPTDQAIFNGQIVYGKKNLRMTGFNFFINGNATYIDPRHNAPIATIDWYNLMQGTVTRSGVPFINPVTSLQTPYTLSGDPVAGTGWLEGVIASPADQRLCMTSGPFTMAAGDTQEVVVAALAAQASDRLSSITFLKFYTKKAQNAYNAFFQVPPSSPTPIVKVTQLDKEILLDWSDPAAVAVAEGPQTFGYKFEGYKVYELTKPGGTATLLAEYDLNNGITTINDTIFDIGSGKLIGTAVQAGTDNGIKRYYDIKIDPTASVPLVNGNKYYFAVTSYNYNPAPLVGSTSNESPIGGGTYLCIPQQAASGNQWNTTEGTVPTIDTSIVKVVGGPTDGSIGLTIINPQKVTNDIYQVNFRQTAWGTKLWSVKDSTLGVVLATDSVYGTSTSTAVVDGIQYNIFDPGVSGGIKSIGATKIGTTTYATPYNILRNPSPDSTWSFDVAGSTNTATAFSRLNWQATMGSNDYEIRITTNGSQYYIDVDGGALAANPRAANRMPVEIWNVTTNTQLLIKVLDDNANGLFDTSSITGVSTLGVKHWDRIYASSLAPYAEPLTNPSGSETVAATKLMGRMTFIDWKGHNGFPPVGTIIKLITNKPIVAGVTSFVVTPKNYAAIYGQRNLALQNVARINVYPNPYFGYNKWEQNRYVRFVTINHLPNKATIRIFDLAGELVKTILHTATSGTTNQEEQWDLNNKAGLPVAAGMYIIHVDMPDLGTSKVLKVAIIPEVQYLDRY